MYNPEFKQEFMNELQSPSYHNSYKALFNKTEKYERELGKDLYDFNVHELENFYYTLATPSWHSLRVTHFFIVNYADYAIKLGVRMSNINAFNLLTSTQLERYTASYKRTYLTREDFDEFMDYIVNDIDVAIFRALFEGVRGNNFSELTNLQPQHIFEENGQLYVKLTNNLPTGEKKHRTIQISRQLQMDFKRAFEQQEYITLNGIDNNSDDKYKYAEIVESPYIFRPVKRGAYKKSDGKINMQTIYRKKDMLNEVTDGQIKNINTLVISGMVDMTKRILDKKGSLTSEEWLKIGEQYDKIVSSEWTTQQVKHIQKLVANGMKELYDIDIYQ